MLRSLKLAAGVTALLAVAAPATAQQRSEFRGWLAAPLWSALPSRGGDLVQSPFVMPAGNQARITEMRVRTGPREARIYCTARDVNIATQAEAQRLGQSIVVATGDIFVADQPGCIRYPGPTADQEHAR